jgi:hypothetical protein
VEGRAVRKPNCVSSASATHVLSCPVKASSLWLQAASQLGLSMRVACRPLAGQARQAGVTGSSPVPPIESLETGATRLQERRRVGINGNASWSVVAAKSVCLRFGYSAWQRVLCSLAFASVRCGARTAPPKAIGRRSRDRWRSSFRSVSITALTGAGPSVRKRDRRSPGRALGGVGEVRNRADQKCQAEEPPGTDPDVRQRRRACLLRVGSHHGHRAGSRLGWDRRRSILSVALAGSVRAKPVITTTAVTMCRKMSATALAAVREPGRTDGRDRENGGAGERPCPLWLPAAAFEQPHDDPSGEHGQAARPSRRRRVRRHRRRVETTRSMPMSWVSAQAARVAIGARMTVRMR